LPITQSIAHSTSGESASLSFQAVNAVSCTGTITGATGGVFTGGTSSKTFCNTANTCNTAINVATSFPDNTSSTNDNTYSVNATCTGADNSTANTSATVTILHGVQPTGGCTRLVPNAAGGSFTGLGGTVNLTYSGHPNALVDITNFDSIYQKAWPGSFGWLANLPVPKAGYISAHFKPAANYFTAGNVPLNLYGEYQIGETFFSAAASMTISTQCGDFSNPQASGSTVVPGCYINSAVADQYLAWTNSAGNCKLSGSTDYYLNVINADITNVTPSGGAATSTANSACGTTTCITPLADGPGSWSGYVPN